MKRRKKSQPRSHCPIAMTLDIVGDRWTLLVLRDALFLGKRNYGDFQSSPEGIATNILAERLQRLEAEGILRKEADPENGKKIDYWPTEKGIALMPVLVEMIIWGARHDPETAAPKEVMRRIAKDKEGFIREVASKLRKAKA